MATEAQGFYRLKDSEWVPTLEAEGAFFVRGKRALFRNGSQLVYRDSRGGISGVPEGAISDGESKSDWFPPAFVGGRFDRHLLPVQLHDEAYATIRRLREAGEITLREQYRMRRHSDWRFRDAMRHIDKATGSGSRWQKRLKHRAVRLFGWIPLMFGKGPAHGAKE